MLFKLEEEDQKAKDKEKKTGRHGGLMIKPKGFRIAASQ